MALIAIAGPTGFLGSILSRSLRDGPILSLSRSSKGGILREEDLVSFWEEKISRSPWTPEILINCAAETDVSMCEKNPKLAREANEILAGRLAELCNEKGIFMIQISTDAVYGGSKSPSHEFTEPVPLSFYAKSKLDGESRVLGAADALVLRVNFFGRNPTGKSVFDYFSQEVTNSSPRIGFHNVVTSSVHVSTLVENILNIADKPDDERPKGILNLGSYNSMSKYDFGSYIAMAKGLNSPEKGLFQAPFISDDEVYDLSMDSSLAKQHGLSVPTMESEIDKAIRLS